MPQRQNFSISTILGGLADPTETTDAATKAYVDAHSGGSVVSLVNDTLVFSTSAGAGGLQLDWAIDPTTEEVSNVQLVFPSNAQTNRNVQVPINDSTGAPLELGSPWATGDGVICYWITQGVEFIYLGIIDTTGTARNFNIAQNENWDRNAPPPVSSSNPNPVNGVKIRRLVLSNNTTAINTSTYPNVIWKNATDNASGARVSLTADVVGNNTDVTMNVSEPDIKEYAQEQIASTIGSSTAVGQTLTLQNSGTTTNIVSIIWDGTRFVALQSDGFIRTSTTGTGTWTQIIRIDTATTFVELAYGGGNYVAVGTGGKTFHSSTVNTWTLTQLPAPNNCTSVAYGNGVFVVTQVVIGSTSAIYRSTNGGSSYTAGTISTGAHSLRSIAYNNSSNPGFLACGDNGLAYSSVDGISWTSVTTNTTQNITNVSYGLLNNFPSFVISGTSTTAGAAIFVGYTPNGGTNWLYSTIGTGTRSVTAGLFCGDRFLVCSYDANNTAGYIAYSTDGQNWLEYQGTPTTASYNSLAFNGSLAVFGTVTGQIYTSLASGVFTFQTPPTNAITTIIASNAVTNLNTLEGAVTLVGAGNTTVSTSGQTITISSTGGGGGSASHVTTFANELSNNTQFIENGGAYTGTINFGFGVQPDTVGNDGGYIGTTQYVKTNTTSTSWYGYALQFPVATTYDTFEVDVELPAFSFSFTTTSTAGTNSWFIDNLLFSSAASSISSPPLLLANIFPGFTLNQPGNDDQTLPAVIAPILNVSGSGTSFTATVTASRWIGIANNYAHSATSGSYVFFIRIGSDTGGVINSVSNFQITSGQGGVRCMLSIPGQGGGGGGGAVSGVPVINFTSSATPSANQTFTSSSLAPYTSADELSVSVNGAVLNRSNYSLSGSVITIAAYLLASSAIQIQPSATTGSTSTGTSVWSETGYHISNANHPTNTFQVIHYATKTLAQVNADFPAGTIITTSFVSLPAYSQFTVASGGATDVGGGVFNIPVTVNPGDYYAGAGVAKLRTNVNPLVLGDGLLYDQYNRYSANVDGTVIALNSDGQIGLAQQSATSGQQLTWNGTRWAPAAAYTLAANKAVFTVSATLTGSATSAQGQFTSLITQRFNNLGLTLNFAAGTMRNFVAGATYELYLQAWNKVSVNPVNAQIFYSCNNNSSTLTLTSYGGGVALNNKISTVDRITDYVSNAAIGYWTPAATTTDLYINYYLDAITAANSLNVVVQLTITRIL